MQQPGIYSIRGSQTAICVQMAMWFGPSVLFFQPLKLFKRQLKINLLALDKKKHVFLKLHLHLQNNYLQAGIQSGKGVGSGCMSETCLTRQS